MVNSQDDLRSLATLQRPSALRFVLQPPPPCAHVSFQQANVASYCPDSTLSVSDAPYSTSSYAKFTQFRSLISNSAQHDDTGAYRTSSRICRPFICPGWDSRIRNWGRATVAQKGDGCSRCLLPVLPFLGSRSAPLWTNH